ncbi:MAG: peroxiredoxin [Paraglaciecola sp.]|uniref:peroxiredoxin n=1 Tax=Paraglaciecola sp. TaxID=1920173 RepID=UPI00273D5D52|nr:peroxiredoxin [Paraglaciecola sp.]MDP5029647.1 peroxiredoxin [Paraglaciecola sp.]MDP5039306.1 peroxiredoxin [Paraglaciecola sp.]MDP5133754.1 peroxiredoxin [Paraglaciecola sp.]
MIKVGDSLPEVTFSLRKNGINSNPTTADIFSGKKVVMFAVPGAFTPTCSEAHLPGYVTLFDEFNAKGIDKVVCTSVNDAFVMTAWGDLHNAEHLIMLADGGADFAKAVGLAKETGTFGGTRSVRYAMLVEDGVVKILNVEAPGKFDVSDAESMLALM